MTGSLFDIVGPVMVGPSSSHTAGAVRLGQLVRLIAPQTIKKANFILYNSFAKTYQGHGTDRGLLAGLMGYSVDDGRIPDAYKLADEAGLVYTFTPYLRANSFPPNTVIFELTLEDGTQMSVTGESTGGGAILVFKIDRFDVQLMGDLPTLLLYYKDKPGMIWRVSKILAEKEINIATLHCSRSEKGVHAFMSITLDSMPDLHDLDAITTIEDVHNFQFIKPIKGKEAQVS